MEETRVGRMKETFAEYRFAYSTVMTFIQACLTNMEVATGAIDPFKDTEIFATEHKSGLSPPLPAEFESPQSHPPPVVRRLPLCFFFFLLFFLSLFFFSGLILTFFFLFFFVILRAGDAKLFSSRIWFHQKAGELVGEARSS